MNAEFLPCGTHQVIEKLNCDFSVSMVLYRSLSRTYKLGDRQVLTHTISDGTLPEAPVVYINITVQAFSN